MKKTLSTAVAIFILLMMAAYYWVIFIAVGLLAKFVWNLLMGWPYSWPLIAAICVILALAKIAGERRKNY